jgi:hypothetical protein
MTNEIVKLIGPLITSLPWVERYGGLVRTATRQFNANKGEDRETNPKWQRQSYPVSCEVTAKDCWDKSRYMDLLPSDSKKSIVYFEEMNGLSFIGYNDNMPKGIKGTNRVQRWQGELRLIAWINQPLLGSDDCSISAEIVGSLINALSVNAGRLSGHPWGAKVTIEVISQEPKSNGLFSKYTYDPEHYLLFYPFDFAALRIRVTMEVNSNCIPEYTPAEAIDCIDYSSPEPVGE